LLVLQLSIKEGEISTGLGKQTKEFDIERKIKIVYLDENLRIARCAALMQHWLLLPHSTHATSDQQHQHSTTVAAAAAEPPPPPGAVTLFVVASRRPPITPQVPAQ
jgi:hypothetical protein